MEEFYETKSDDAKRFGELAQQAVADGFTAFKSMAVPETAPIEGLPPIRYAEACVKAMREAVGDKIDIMVDCHARPSPRMGLQFAKALEPYGLYFLEEPCWPETMEDIALIQRAVRTPIATGERLVGIHSFRELFEKRAASVIQPDITHCGGSGRWISGHPISNGANSSLGPVQPACWRWPQCKNGAFFLVSGTDLTVDSHGKVARSYLRDAYRFNPATGWKRIADVPKPVVAAPSPAAPFARSKILVLRADDGSTAGFQPLELHPGFSKDMSIYDTQDNYWHSVGQAPVSCAAIPMVEWKQRFVIPSGELRPGVRFPQVWAVVPEY